MLLSTGLYEEIRQCREACGEAHMKTILATGELGSLANVYKASMIAMMAGKYMCVLLFKLRMSLLYYSWSLKNSSRESLVLPVVGKNYYAAITEVAGVVMKYHLFCITYKNGMKW